MLKVQSPGAHSAPIWLAAAQAAASVWDPRPGPIQAPHTAPDPGSQPAVPLWLQAARAAAGQAATPSAMQPIAPACAQLAPAPRRPRRIERTGAPGRSSQAAQGDPTRADVHTGTGKRPGRHDSRSRRSQTHFCAANRITPTSAHEDRPAKSCGPGRDDLFRVTTRKSV